MPIFVRTAIGSEVRRTRNCRGIYDHLYFHSMKKSFYLFLLLLACVLVLPNATAPTPAPAIKYPKKVDAIIQAKCYGCHSPESRGEKARMKLNWDELATLPEAQQLEKIHMIEAVIEKGAMPPAGFVEKNPDMKLTEDETKRLQKWAMKTGKKLSK